LLLPLLLDLSKAGFDGVEPSQMIASGLLIEQADEVSAAFSDAHGLFEQDRRVSGEWAALLLARHPL
jgi:ribosomal protein L11 methylase PrmA